MTHTSALVLFLAALSSHALRLGNNDKVATNESRITWAQCDPSTVQNPALSCSFLDVPLDYNDADAGNARLALGKINALIQPAIGAVFVNPGGPGISGIETLNSTSALLLAVTGGLYDIVSWDPRGVGLTHPGPITCFDDAAEFNAFFNGTVELTGIEMTGNFTDPEDVKALLSQASLLQRKYEEVGRRCLEHPNGKYMQYVGTTAAARDIAAIADAIGGTGSLVNYVGISYGTLVGSHFVNMFPERVGRVILDGVLDPVFFATEELSLGWSRQLVDADSVYKAFYTGCALAGPQGCAIASSGNTPSDVNNTIQALLQTAHDATRANKSVPITSGQIRTALYSEMYSPKSWIDYANMVYPQVAAIVQGEAPKTRTREVSGQRKSLFKRQSQPSSAVSFTQQAIFCGDGIDRTNTTMADVFQSLIAASRNVSPMFGAAWPSPVSYCSFWPTRAVERYPGPFNKTLANKIVVVGNTFDPVTPFAGAQAVTDLLGDSATLVRLNAFGHTNLAEPSSCLLGIAQAYFVNGTLPSKGTVCEVDGSFEVFKGVNTSAILSNIPK